MDPQFTHLIFGRCFSRILSRSPPQTSITSNPSHRAHAISPPLPPSSKAMGANRMSVADRTVLSRPHIHARPLEGWKLTDIAQFGQFVWKCTTSERETPRRTNKPEVCGLIVSCMYAGSPQAGCNIEGLPMTLHETEVQRMVADFMKASTALETYLQQGGPLSPLQVDLVASTLSGLQTFFEIWKRQNMVKNS
jgi:hypothetical protein